MTLSEKIISFRTFSNLHFKQTRLSNILSKEILKKTGNSNKESDGQIGCYLMVTHRLFVG